MYLQKICDCFGLLFGSAGQFFLFLAGSCVVDWDQHSGHVLPHFFIELWKVDFLQYLNEKKASNKRTVIIDRSDAKWQWVAGRNWESTDENQNVRVIFICYDKSEVTAHNWGNQFSNCTFRNYEFNSLYMPLITEDIFIVFSVASLLPSVIQSDNSIPEWINWGAFITLSSIVCYTFACLSFFYPSFSICSLNLESDI